MARKRPPKITPKQDDAIFKGIASAALTGNTGIRFIPVGEEREDCFESMGWQCQVGKQLGYPPCCVASFIAMVQTHGEPTAQQTHVANHTGFIPCMFHTTAIIVGAVKLEDLIEGRDPSLKPFPHAQ